MVEYLRVFGHVGFFSPTLFGTLGSLMSTITSMSPVQPGSGVAPYNSEMTWVPNWVGIFGFVLLHVACLAVWFTGTDPVALTLCAVCYLVRMFGITAGYHRYFAHRAYKTSRAFQFVLAWLGCSAMQKGPLWWAPHHREHHRHSDTPEDPHSPLTRGFWWSHVGWILAPDHDDDLLGGDPRLEPVSGTALAGPLPLAARSSLAVAVLSDRRLERPGLGLRHQHGAVAPRHLRGQLAVPPVRPPPLRDHRRQPQQPAGRR